MNQPPATFLRYDNETPALFVGRVVQIFVFLQQLPPLFQAFIWRRGITSGRTRKVSIDAVCVYYICV